MNAALHQHYAEGLRRLRRYTKDDLMHVVTLQVGLACMDLALAHQFLKQARGNAEKLYLATLRREHLYNFRRGIRNLMGVLGKESWPAIRSIMRYHLRSQRLMASVTPPQQEAA